MLTDCLGLAPPVQPGVEALAGAQVQPHRHRRQRQSRLPAQLSGQDPLGGVALREVPARAAIGTAHDVVNGVRILNALFAGQAWRLRQYLISVETIV